MRTDVHLIYLANHAPSAEIKGYVEFWLKDRPLISLATSPVTSNGGMKRVLKENRLKDLPALVVTKNSSRDVYYGDEIKTITRAVRDKRWSER